MAMSKMLDRILSRLVPSLGAATAVALAAASLSPIGRISMISSDGDPCTHWATGAWMIEHREMVRADQFSHTALGRPLLTKEWLSQLLYAAAGNQLGYNGLVLLAAALIGTTFFALYRQLRRENADILVALAVTVLAAWTSAVHWLARPHMFTLLFAVLWHNALRNFDRDENSARKTAFTLGFLMLAWANLHGGFVVGLVQTAIFAAANVKRRQKFLAFSALFALGAAVSLVNPNGWRLPAHVLNFLHKDFSLQFLAEFASPNFHSAFLRPFLVMLAVTVLVLAVPAPRASGVGASDAVTTVLWLVASLISARHIPLFAVLAAPMLAERLSAVARQGTIFERISAIIARADARCRGGWLAAAVGIAWALQLPSVVPDPKQFPVDAIKFVMEHPERFRGKMFNHYKWGGFLMKELPEHRVFIDGRPDFYGEKLCRDYLDIENLQSDWREQLAQYDISWILVPPTVPLARVLAENESWEGAYRDGVAVIFVRASG
jgi:hypothetical protein